MSKISFVVTACIILLFGGVIMIFGVMPATIGTKTDVLGTVINFEVSAGGFGSSDMCSILYENLQGEEDKIVGSGRVCSKLKRGLTLVDKGQFLEVRNESV